MNHRFVVLEHTPGRLFKRQLQPHFDWMFESDGGLLTWATAPIDFFEKQLVVVARPLPVHRLRYLDFEGDIGEDRGEVRQRIAGDYALLRRDEQHFAVEIQWPREGEPRHHRQVRFDCDSGKWRLSLC
ncbi:hypothetical protein [Novipirellula artificiosorum]|nr:hypothetical protein [Novipirellula artificiosorum]